MIGGRGTGKSTVIESLRYVLDLHPLGKDAESDHRSMINDVVLSGTSITVEVETVLPRPRHYTIERIVPNAPVVRDASGIPTNLAPSDVTGHVEIFGQHELAELASSPEGVAEMVQRFAGEVGSTAEHELVLEQLEENRTELERAEQARAKVEQELHEIPRLEEQVRQFEESEVNEQLQGQQALDKEESIFAEAKARVADTETALSNFLDPQVSRNLAASLNISDSSGQKMFLATWRRLSPTSRRRSKT